MAIKYTMAVPVVEGTAPTSWHYNRLAKAFNDRLLNGVGDPTWRIFWYAHALFRNPRNPADQFTWPAADEWWKFYAFVDPERNPGEFWPLAGPGEPEGANVANPIMAFVYGLESADLDPEVFRFGVIPLSYVAYTEEDAQETEKIYPLFRSTAFVDYAEFATVHGPLTPFEAWEMGKSQRGGMDPDNGIRYAPAVDVPRVFFNFRYPTNAPYLKAFSSFQPLPDSGVPESCAPLCSDCPSYPNVIYKFSPLKPELPVITFPGSCLDKPGHVVSIFRGRSAYAIYTNAGNGRYNRIVLSYNDYIEGPYGGGGQLSKVDGSQIEQAMNRYGAAFKGNLDERAAADYTVCESGAGFQSFLSRQYALAPAYSNFSGGYLNPVYPEVVAQATETEFTVSANADLPFSDLATIPSGFCVAGFYLSVFRAQPSTAFTLKLLHGESAEYEITFTTDTNGNAEILRYFTAPLHGEVSLKNGPVAMVLSAGDANPAPFDVLELPGKLFMELAVVEEMKPDVTDAYAVLRLASAYETISSVDGRGEDADGQAILLESVTDYGYLKGPIFGMVSDDYVNSNPIYDSARLLIKDNLRMLPKDSLRGYEVINEAGVQKSVLYFSRWSSATPSSYSKSPVDLSPPSDLPVTSASAILKPETVYLVTGARMGTGNLGGFQYNERYNTYEVKQDAYVNYPVTYLPDGSVNSGVNRWYVGQFFKTGPITSVTPSVSDETTDPQPGVGGTVPGKDYKNVTWQVDDTETYAYPCLLERRRLSGLTVLEDWTLMQRYASQAPVEGFRNFAYRDFQAPGLAGTVEYRVRFGDLTFSQGSTELVVVPATYHGTAPEEPRYTCAPGHSYLCPGREYAVGGEDSLAVLSPGMETVETPGGIWLVDAVGQYVTEMDINNLPIPMFIPSGTQFVCPETVTGFTLIPPMAGDPMVPAEPDNSAPGNGTSTVIPVSFGNIEDGIRYRVEGDGEVEYNERTVPANGIDCATFDQEGHGMDKNGGPCCEFIGKPTASIARMQTGNERLYRIDQEMSLADGLDQFLGLGPAREAVVKIRSGVRYVVSAVADGYISYNGNNYANGSFFTGETASNLPVETFTVHPAVGETETSVQVYEYDGIQNEAPMKGFTNQWSVFMTFNAYHWSQSSIWKASNYGDQLCFLHNRCNFYSPDWVKPEHKDLLVQFSYGQKPVVVAETPSGYTYVKGTNNPPSGWDLQTRINYFRSCQIYKPDLRVERAEMLPSTNEIRIVLSGRLQTCIGAATGAPSTLSTIPRDYYDPNGGAFDARLIMLRGEPYKTDENSILEYVICAATDCENSTAGNSAARNCIRNRLGDGAAGTVLWGLPDDPFGSCIPRFYFTKLVPYAWPYVEGEGIVRSTAEPDCERNTKLNVVPFIQMQLYLEAMAGGFIDGRATRAGLDCDDLTSKLWDYSFPQLCYQSLADSNSIIQADTDVETLTTKTFRVTWPQGSVDAEPEYVVQRGTVPLLPGGGGGGPGTVSWTSVATVANNGEATGEFTDRVTYRAGTVHSFQYKVSTLTPTEIVGNVEAAGENVFEERIVSWDTAIVSGTVEVGREITRITTA